MTITRQAVTAPSAFDLLQAAETAAWDDYETALTVAQEIQDSFVAAGASALKAYNAVQWRRNAACNALGDALAVARAEYDDGSVVTSPPLAALAHSRIPMCKF